MGQKLQSKQEFTEKKHNHEATKLKGITQAEKKKRSKCMAHREMFLSHMQHQEPM